MLNVSPKDWGAFFVSLVMLGFFGAYEFAIVFYRMPANDGLSNTLNALVMLVAGYWIGSSSGSKNKDAVISQITQSGKTPAP